MSVGIQSSPSRGGLLVWLVDDESSERVENSSRSGRRTLLEAEFIDRVSLLL